MPVSRIASTMRTAIGSIVDFAARSGAASNGNPSWADADLPFAGPADHSSSPSPEASRLHRRSVLRAKAACARERMSGSG